MKTPMKVVIVAVLAVVVASAVALKKSKAAPETSTAAPATNATVAATHTAPVTTAKLPKLLDLGATQCIPCKMMAPILEGLKKEYAGRMEVEFIDVWENREAGKPYNIEMIPTQIFFDAEGKELFRHTGFFSKEDILAKWMELGVELKPKK